MRDITRPSMARLMRRIGLGLLLGLAWIGAHGREAAPLAGDPALEARVLQIADELRCLVCQNETLAASQAALAIDLRQQIRSRLQQGESDARIVDFMVERYGEFIRYRPTFSIITALLWTGPFLLLALAAFVLAANIRRRRIDAAAPPLSEAELLRARALLAGARR
ncbi:MAG: cytochrome c-type biogenesis protein [Caldimonas sp.]